MRYRWIRTSLASAVLSTALIASPAAGLFAEEAVLPAPAPAEGASAAAPAMPSPANLPTITAPAKPDSADRAASRAFQDKALKALSTTLQEAQKIDDTPLITVLDLVAKSTGLTVHADQRLDKRIWDTKVSLAVPAGEDFATVLGSAIAQVGLRYLIKDDQIFVSTPEGCAARLVGTPTLDEEKKAAADIATQPFSGAEALEIYRAKDNDGDEMPSLDLTRPNYIDQSVNRAPVTDPMTGIVHYYAPTQQVSSQRPVSPYEKYSVYPYFLQPPYLDQARQEDNANTQAAQQAAQEALLRYAHVLKMLAANPDMKAADVMANLKSGK